MSSRLYTSFLEFLQRYPPMVSAVDQYEYMAERDELLTALAAADSRSEQLRPSEALLVDLEAVLLRAQDEQLSWPQTLALARQELLHLEQSDQERLRSILRKSRQR